MNNYAKLETELAIRPDDIAFYGTCGMPRPALAHRGLGWLLKSTTGGPLDSAIA